MCHGWWGDNDKGRKSCVEYDQRRYKCNRIKQKSINDIGQINMIVDGDISTTMLTPEGIRSVGCTVGWMGDKMR